MRVFANGAALERTLWDISPALSTATPTWPGDTPFSQEIAWKLEGDCPVNVGRITLSPHTGAHADAPLHYDDAGEAPAALSLRPYLGACRVVHAIGAHPLVTREHVAHALKPGMPPRLLVRCYTRMPQRQWDAELAGLDATLVDELADLGVLLIGIDTASIDPADSKSLPSHQAIRRRGLRVLENLVLDAVPEGDYELIALPLKLGSACASPVRAVLRALATEVD